MRSWVKYGLDNQINLIYKKKFFSKKQKENIYKNFIENLFEKNICRYRKRSKEELNGYIQPIEMQLFVAKDFCHYIYS